MRIRRTGADLPQVIGGRRAPRESIIKSHYRNTESGMSRAVRYATRLQRDYLRAHGGSAAGAIWIEREDASGLVNLIRIPNKT